MLLSRRQSALEDFPVAQVGPGRQFPNCLNNGVGAGSLGSTNRLQCLGGIRNRNVIDCDGRRSAAQAFGRHPDNPASW